MLRGTPLASQTIWIWCSGHTCCAPVHALPALLAPIFPVARTGSGCSYHRGVGHPCIQIEQPFLTQANVQPFKQLFERPVFPPITEALIHGRSWAEAFRYIAPSNAQVLFGAVSDFVICFHQTCNKNQSFNFFCTTQVVYLIFGDTFLSHRFGCVVR